MRLLGKRSTLERLTHSEKSLVTSVQHTDVCESRACKSPSTSKRKKIVGRVKHHELVTVIGQAITFNEGGVVAKIETSRGWVSYNHHGLIGHRYFVLVNSSTAHGDVMGSVMCNINYSKHNNLCQVHLLRCEIDGCTMKEGQLPIEERTVRDGVYVIAQVNGHRERSTVVQLSSLEWKSGQGETLEFDMKSLDTQDMESIVIKVYGVKISREWLSTESDDLIGLHSVALDQYLDLDEWQLEAVGPDALIVREELGSLPDHLHPERLNGDISRSPEGQKTRKAESTDFTADNPLFADSSMAEMTMAEVATANKGKKGAKKIQDTSLAYRCVKQTLLRKQAGLGSEKCGQLDVGIVVEVTEEKLVYQDGNGAKIEGGLLRLRVKGLGWCSKAGMNGDSIMQKVKIVDQPQANQTINPMIHAGAARQPITGAKKPGKLSKLPGRKKRGGQPANDAVNPMFDALASSSDDSSSNSDTEVDAID